MPEAGKFALIFLTFILTTALHSVFCVPLTVDGNFMEVFLFLVHMLRYFQVVVFSLTVSCATTSNVLLRKAIIDSVTSACLSNCPHWTALFPLENFNEIGRLKFFKKIRLWQIDISLESEKNDRYFAWRLYRGEWGNFESFV
jgi:hypothetical protein